MKYMYMLVILLFVIMTVRVILRYRATSRRRRLIALVNDIVINAKECQGRDNEYKLEQLRKVLDKHNYYNDFEIEHEDQRQEWAEGDMGITVRCPLCHDNTVVWATGLTTCDVCNVNLYYNGKTISIA